MDGPERHRLQTIADYQFGPGAGAVLFPDDEALTVHRTSSGRPQQIEAATGERLVSYGVDGRFTLGLAGGRRLFATTGQPAVTVGTESVPFVSEGKNAFAKFVTGVDRSIRPGDEVLVICGDSLLAVGRAELGADGMTAFDTGVAVSVRTGNPDASAD